MFSLSFFVQTSDLVPAEKIDINLAGAEELQKITGLGPVMADRIIEARQSCYFYPLSSLTTIKGIGLATWQKIADEGKAFVLPPEDNSLPLCQPSDVSENQENPVRQENLPISKEISKIDINSASLEELIKISGVGQVKGQAIISQRPFFSLNELEEVKGIGEKTLQEIKDQGLAWVDPELRQEKEVIKPNKDIPVESKNKQEQEKEPSFPFLPASFLAFSSGALILTLKKNLAVKS